MGNIIKKLKVVQMPVDRPTLQTTRLIFEKCENIHVHYRNLRLEFSRKEFISFAEEMQSAFCNLDIHPDDVEYAVLSNSLIEENSVFFPNRISIEANIGSIHLHYRNYRLEFTKEEFEEFASATEEAKISLSEMRPVVKELPLSLIDPFDAGHVKTESGFKCHNHDKHIEQIEKIKKAILNGERIRPIVVYGSEEKGYFRKDGFCRYIAYCDLNKDKIEAIICPLATAGCQDKKPFVVSKEEYDNILQGKTY